MPISSLGKAGMDLAVRLVSAHFARSMLRCSIGGRGVRLFSLALGPCLAPEKETGIETEGWDRAVQVPCQLSTYKPQDLYQRSKWGRYNSAPQFALCNQRFAIRRGLYARYSGIT